MQSPPPTEYFPGIQFNPLYYQASYEPVTKIYVDTNFLKCVGYAYSRSISTSFSGVINADGGINTTNITVTGTITSNWFSGSGANLTSLNVSSVSTGTLSAARGGTGKNTLTVTQLLVGNNTDPIIQSGNLTWDNSNNILTVSNIADNGSRLTNLNTTNINDGTMVVTRGGTGPTNFTTGRLLIGNGTNQLQKMEI